MFSFFRKKSDPAATPAPAQEPPGTAPAPAPAPSAPLEFLKRVFTGMPPPPPAPVAP